MNEPELMAINWNNGERICGTGCTVEQVVNLWKITYEDEKMKSKIKIRCYNGTLWNIWKYSWQDGEVLALIGCLQEDRKIEIGNTDEYQTITEFLWLHDTSFTVSKIDSRYNSCTIEIIGD